MKMIRRLSCVLLAVLLVLGLSSTAFAAAAEVEGNTAKDQGSFTVTINSANAGHTFEAYQIFKGDLYQDPDKGDTLSNIEWGKNIDAEKAAELFQGQTAAQVAETLQGKSFDAEEAQDFADKIAQCLTGEPAGSSTQESAPYTIEKLPCGYYLIKDKDGSVTGNDFYTRFILQVVSDSAVTPKGGVPQVEKEVQDSNNSDGSNGYGSSADRDVGDVISFRLTATLPSNYSDYEKYTLIFHDTMSEGLTFNKESVHVAIADENGTDITAKFVLTETSGEDGYHGFDLKAEDLVGTEGLGNGVKIVVTYTATLNDKAQFKNDNKVTLEYSNNPNVDEDGKPEPGTGTTPPSVAVVFVFEVDVNKVQPDGAGKTKELVGAAFKLEKFYQEAADGKEAGWNMVKEYTVEGDGSISQFGFSGLDDGLYRLTETVTPAGFNTIEPIYFLITANHSIDAEGNETVTLSVKQVKGTEDGTYTDIGEEENKAEFTIKYEASGAGSGASTDVLNQSGLQLPETGGIGTTLFYVLGGVLVAGALVLLVTKRRMKNER